MSDLARINLVFDPYRISGVAGERVRNVVGELKAFREIALHLNRDPRYETVTPRTYLVETSWEHFRTYQGLRGVHMEVISPRGLVRTRYGAEPPGWLTDRLIADSNLLDPHRSFASLVDDDWAATLGACVFPGIADATSLDQWLGQVAIAPMLPSCWRCEPVTEWLCGRFVALARHSIHSVDVVVELRDALHTSSSPVSLVRDWIRRRSLLAVLRHDVNRVLAMPGLFVESARSLVLAGYLPQLFPLPDTIHADVSEVMRRAMRHARLKVPDAFEAAILELNALWDGVPDEISAWLDLRPRAMTAQTILHLRTLPGYEASELTQRLVANYAPPDPVSSWAGLDERFNTWVGEYAAFTGRVFCRRELPSMDVDPATPFGRWLKDNSSVVFNHPEHGYRYVAKTIQRALQHKRAVLVILIDALAIHLTALATGYLAGEMQAQPTRLNHIFVPLPTVTEVCKEAILTGQFPSECQGNLSQGLVRSYGVDPAQMCLAANWQDAERLQVGPQTRLVVYRDNRVDDQLKTAGTYKVLAEECSAVLIRIARLVRRWVGDLRDLHDAPPLVILTADHGFTFGPPPGSETQSRRKIDASRRCVKLSEPANSADLSDESVTFIDKSIFHLHNSYLAARGRYFGAGTAAGWILSHGGLLPEEVIVPVVEWFGEETAIRWPEISFPRGVSRDRDRWILAVSLRNTHALPMQGVVVTIGVAGADHRASQAFALIGPGDSREFTAELRGESPADDSDGLPVDATVTLSSDKGADARQVCRFSIPKAKQFVIRTAEQAAFEDMF